MTPPESLRFTHRAGLHTFPQSGSQQARRIGHGPYLIRGGSELWGSHLPKVITLLSGRAGLEPCFWCLFFFISLTLILYDVCMEIITHNQSPKASLVGQFSIKPPYLTDTC